jgi:hypothetical protein
MADASRKPPTQFQVRKDTGDWWTVTYGGPKGKGIHWDPLSLDEQPNPPDPSPKYAEFMQDENQRAGQWSGFFEELLFRFLEVAKPYVEEAIEEAKPYIKAWWEETGLPWVKATATTVWDRIIKKTSVTPDDANSAEDIRVTDVDPSTAINRAKGVEDDAKNHPLNLTAEQAQKQLEDIAVLTKFVAANLRELTGTLEREAGESKETFSVRREEAEQLAARNLTSNIQLLLIQGFDLSEALQMLADNTPVFAAVRGETRPLSIEGSSERPRGSQSDT